MARRIEKVAVIGSGIMGGGIAALTASAGIKTILLDIVPFDLKDDEKTKKDARNRIVKAGFENTMKAKPSLFMDKKYTANVEIGNLEDDIKKLGECDWIVEVVVENLKIKQELFAKIDKVRKPDAIISTNTSGLPLNQISEKFSKGMKEHFLGTHFFNPVRYMHLLEIIPGKDTKKEILDFMAEFGEKVLGKGIVWCKDTPNFIGNRIGVQSMVYTMQVMEEMGITVPEVDALFGPPMGRPKTAAFKTADLVGLDTFSHVANNCYELCPKDEARETLKLPAFVMKMVENKWFGNKTKGGFYKSEVNAATWQKIKKVLNYKTMQYEEFPKPDFPCLAASKDAKNLPDKMKAVVFGEDKGAQFAWKVVAGCLIYAANRIPEISDTIVEIDNAMKWGYNWELGPFETWDAIGVKESVKKMEKDGFTVPKKIKKMLEDGFKSFYINKKGVDYYFDFKKGDYKEVAVSDLAINLKNLRADKKVALTSGSASLIDLNDGIFCLEFHSKMNAINKEMVEFMGKAAKYVYENGQGIVIGNQAGGMPGAFSAGGDLTYMLSLARDKKFSEIDSFIKMVHEGIMGLRYSPFPVVAAPYGMTLGGGCEVSLAADKMVAHAELYMGLVEVGAGLVPGGCGMINLWRKFMDSVPGPAKVTDLGAFFIPAFMNVAQAKVSRSADEAAANGFLGPKDRIVYNRDTQIGEAKKEVLRMIEDGYTPPMKKKIIVMGAAAQGMVDAEMLNMKVGGYITPHMMFIAKKIAYCMSGGNVLPGTQVSEEHLMKLEREAFVELWSTENTQKMAEHILKTGKPLFL